MIIYGPYMIIYGPYMIRYGPYMIIYGPYMITCMCHGRSTCIMPYKAQFLRHAGRGVGGRSPLGKKGGLGGR